MVSTNPRYFAASATLPAKLPTIAEILASQDVLKELGGRKIVGVGDHFVAKYGSRVDLLEGETMLFLNQSTTIPLPRVYAFFYDSDTKHNYIIMERICGEPLASAWPQMTDHEKETTTTALQVFFEKMRKLKSPGGYCRLNQHGLPGHIFRPADSLEERSGRFDSESDLNDALLAKYVESGLPKFKAEFYSQIFKRVFRDHEPTFTHADFQRKNIMIQRSSGANQSAETRENSKLEVVVIDWENAGWYPSYWEYTIAIFTCGTFSDDWFRWVNKMLDPAVNECSWMSSFLLEMWS
jgi:Phosphotransferase enzyme family